MIKKWVLLCLYLCLYVNVCWATEQPLIASDFGYIKNDYKEFYLNKDNLFKLGVGIAGAAIVANTSMDGDIQEFYQDNVRGKTTDSVSDILKIPGEVLVTIPLLVSTRFLLRDTSAGEWAQKSLRAIFVGAPAGLFIQRITGASRPSEGDSKWRPFEDANGLSGHAFIGAVPFITVARMNDNPYLKATFYTLSVLPGLSRINDNKHFFSQTALGWYLALLSCNAVEKTDHKDGTAFSIVPFSDEGAAIFLSYSF